MLTNLNEILAAYRTEYNDEATTETLTNIFYGEYENAADFAKKEFVKTFGEAPFIPIEQHTDWETIGNNLLDTVEVIEYADRLFVFMN